MYKTRALFGAIIWAILPHPSLYLSGLRLYRMTLSNEGNILIRLLPSKRYIDFRLHTQYGDELPKIEVLKKDFIDYLTWVKDYKELNS